MSLRVFIPVIKNYTPCFCKPFLQCVERSLSAQDIHARWGTQQPFCAQHRALLTPASGRDICKEDGREAACPGLHSESNGRLEERQDKHKLIIFAKNNAHIQELSKQS